MFERSGLARPGQFNVPYSSGGGSGDTLVLVAPGPNSFNVVTGYVFVSGGVCNVTMKCGLVAVSGPMPVSNNSGVASGYNENGWFTCPDNQPFVINTDQAVAMGGHVDFIVKGF